MAKIKLPELKLDLRNKHVVKTLKKVQFLDIETSLMDTRVFRTGLQTITAADLLTKTRILTVAGGSFYDLYTKGEKGIWGYSNHQNTKAFKKDPLDDTHVLAKVWDILDNADVIIAHNIKFDKGWLLGRFAELGWSMPSRFATICTYQSLTGLNMASKKLDELSSTLVGSNKIKTEKKLWHRCSDGEVAGFKEMLKYNKGDIYDTLYKVYMRTCTYYPQKCVDMTDYTKKYPQCRVSGQKLTRLSRKHVNHGTGREYALYYNGKNGIYYIDRHTIGSNRAGQGYIKHYK